MTATIERLVILGSREQGAGSTHAPAREANTLGGVGETFSALKSPLPPFRGELDFLARTKNTSFLNRNLAKPGDGTWRVLKIGAAPSDWPHAPGREAKTMGGAGSTAPRAVRGGSGGRFCGKDRAFDLLVFGDIFFFYAQQHKDDRPVGKVRPFGERHFEN